MAVELSAREKVYLDGVHQDLVKIILQLKRISVIPYWIVEGRRSYERQKMLYAMGATKTLKSRHLTGHAVDIVPLIDGQISWHWPHYYPLAAAIKRAAADISVPIEWGGDWKSFPDGPHWQLPWEHYPA